MHHAVFWHIFCKSYVANRGRSFNICIDALSLTQFNNVVCSKGTYLLCLCTVTPEGTVFVMPKNVSVSDGQSITFMCVVDLAGTYKLQWSHSGEALLGENQSLLTVSDVTAAQGGNYTCSVVNVVGSGMDAGTLYGKCDANHEFHDHLNPLCVRKFSYKYTAGDLYKSLCFSSSLTLQSMPSS